jgi:hypothetical protein
MTPRGYEDKEWAEPDVDAQTKSLTGRYLSEVIGNADIVSRRPYLCAVCAGPFTIEQFHQLRRLSRQAGLPRPFDSVEPVHEGCADGSRR